MEEDRRQNLRLKENHSNGEFNLTIYHDYYEVSTYTLITTKTKMVNRAEL